MAEVNVEISGRKYRMACEEGQEEHLQTLARRFDKMVEGFKSTFGEIGDTRLTVMAGIAVLDELADAERRIDSLRKELTDLSSAGDEMAQETEALENQFARKMDDVARRLEVVASSIDAVG